MREILAHDTVNDIAIIRTAFGLSIRYGLQVAKVDTMHEAIAQFTNCVAHAMQCEGIPDVYPDWNGGAS